jgi:hypothetical protein
MACKYSVRLTRTVVILTLSDTIDWGYCRNWIGKTWKIAYHFLSSCSLLFSLILQLPDHLIRPNSWTLPLATVQPAPAVTPWLEFRIRRGGNLGNEEYTGRVKQELVDIWRFGKFVAVFKVNG